MSNKSKIMKRLQTICTLAGFVLTAGGLAQAASIDTVTLTPNPIAEDTWTTITVTTTDIDMVAIRGSNYFGFNWLNSGENGTFTGGIHGFTASIVEVDVYGYVGGQVVAEESILLVVYDPDGGFVTGGGWIDSPPGAYVPEPTLEGRAHFGFVSKYKNGATVPTGHTGFVFKTADFSFQSSSYQWLVVNQSGTNAQFKGEGTINGEGDYGFMLWAKDDDHDALRIKIWKKEDEDVVYDNEEDQTIESGNIIVHTSKEKDDGTCPYCGGDPCVPPCDGTGTGV
ncbi:MAG: hypothetical protein WBC05_09955 [Sedimentisphaerales bacterium]